MVQDSSTQPMIAIPIFGMIKPSYFLLFRLVLGNVIPKIGRGHMGVAYDEGTPQWRYPTMENGQTHLEMHDDWGYPFFYSTATVRSLQIIQVLRGFQPNAVMCSVAMASCSWRNSLNFLGQGRWAWAGHNSHWGNSTEQRLCFLVGE